MKDRLVAFLPGCIAILLTGCAGERTDFNPPAYHAQTPYENAQTYNLHQAINQVPPPQSGPQAANQPPIAQLAPASASPGSTTSTGLVAQTTAPTQQDVIPPSPGPDYVWMPSYWNIGVGGNWVWVGGHYVIRRGVPEEQLRAARGMLEQARVGLTGAALKMTDKAIDQVNEALRDHRQD